MLDKILIVDFGSQTTQLIGRRIREMNVYCEIVPYNKVPEPQEWNHIKGIILSGSPFSINSPEAFKADLANRVGRVAILGICYGAQHLANH